MAEVDTSIYRFTPKSAADYQDEDARRQSNRLALLIQQGQYADQSQARAQRNRLLQALQGLGADATDDQRMSVLKSNGAFDQADALQKSILERQKTAAQVEKDNAAAEKDKIANAHAKIDRHLQMIAGVQTPDQYMQWLNGAVRNGVLNMQEASQSLNAVKANPAAFQEEVQRFSDMGLGLKLKLEQVWKQKGYDLQAQQAAETSRHNKASEGLTARGQNMTDQRARDAIEQGKTPAGYRKGADGNLEFIPGGPADPAQINAKSQGKPLAQAAAKQITEARDNAATIDRLTESFKPDFASKGVLGLGSNASLAVKGVLGTDGDAVEWWKNYRKQAELVERHALFGAALTPTEQASWQSADISPGMDAKVIKRNLETRRALTKKIFENTQQDLIDAGHSPERINAISARNTTVEPKTGVVDFNSLK